jgi:hypothetical protein
VRLETTTSTGHAEIHLPTTQGMILLKLVHKAYKDDFITLEHKICNLGEKKIKVIMYVDWFNTESGNIHQQVHKIASKGVLAGDSEQQTKIKTYLKKVIFSGLTI